MRYVESLMRPFSEPEVNQESCNGLTRIHTLELSLEEIASARPVTERVRHFKSLKAEILSTGECGGPLVCSPGDVEDGRSESGKVDDCDYSASPGWLRHIPSAIQFYPRSHHPPTKHNTNTIPKTDLLKKNAKVGTLVFRPHRYLRPLQGTTKPFQDVSFPCNPGLILNGGTHGADRFLCNSNSYKVPRRPFESARLDAELKVRGLGAPLDGFVTRILQLAGEFGLRNKRELWRIALILSKIRRAARELLKLDEKDPKRLFEGNALIRRLVRIGVLDENRMRLDYVLALKIEDFLERRLQTQVFKSGLAKSIHHARVLIRQRHIR